MSGPDPDRARPTDELMTAPREAKADFHRQRERLPPREKVQLVLELQRICLPLLERQRPLKPWECVWLVEP